LPFEDLKVVEDKPLEEKLFQERAWIIDINTAYPHDRIFIFRVPHGEAQCWDMSRNCREKDIAHIVFDRYAGATPSLVALIALPDQSNYKDAAPEVAGTG